MNKLQIVIIGILSLIVGSSYAQDNRTLVTIANENVPVDEFMYVYKKNNTQDTMLDKKSIEEYLDLYINFKLKVKEAEALGLDTVSSYKKELAGYRDQLAEPYFVNEDVLDDLVKEAYDRMKTDIRASHILIKVNPDAMPEDTLVAYKKIMDARKRVEKGESFAKVAKEVSDDPSARDRVSPRNHRTVPGNGGDLGYFTVFDMVYPFENGAYETPVGKISKPVRSDFGYHIIKVTDKIPAQGTIEAAHLFLQMPDSASHQDSVNIKLRIDSLYTRIKNGENFEDLVKKYSDDKGSASRGGLLPKFTVNRMVPEFIQAISQMHDSGDISKPVLTSYGWHIIKLYSKTGIKPFDQEKDELLMKVKKDSRAQKSKDVIISDIKKEFGFTTNTAALTEIYNIMDSSIYKGKWEVPADAKLDAVLFTLGKEKYSQKQFADFIAGDQASRNGETLNEFVNRKFKDFTDKECKEYKNARLEEMYPEFKAIMKEYRDGILLFELTNEKIWSYATKDTVGLKNYYAGHKKDFMWDTRLDATLITLNDTAYLGQARDLAKSGKTGDEILKQLNGDSLHIVRVEHKKYSKGDSPVIDAIKWKKGISENVPNNGKISFAIVNGKLDPEPKSFDEARGLITAAYQDYLEKEWIKQLREKYPVVVHEDVLATLIK